MSPLTCRAFKAARVALIASASAAEASTKDSTPLLNLLQETKKMIPMRVEN